MSITKKILFKTSQTEENLKQSGDKKTDWRKIVSPISAATVGTGGSFVSGLFGPVPTVLGMIASMATGTAVGKWIKGGNWSLKPPEGTSVVKHLWSEYGTPFTSAFLSSVFGTITAKLIKNIVKKQQKIETEV